MTPKIDLLCLSSTRWDYIWQRPQQMMSRIARKHRVLYIDHVYPIAHQEIFQLLNNLSLLKNRVKQINENLIRFSLVEFSSDAFGSNLNPSGMSELNRWVKTIFINAILKELNIEQPVIWTCLPNSRAMVENIPHRLVCYDCVDDFASFSWWPPETKIEEIGLIEAADIVFATAISLFKRCQAHNVSTYLIPNAADYEHFSSPSDPKSDLIRAFPKPIIGYIGAFYEWIDVQLLLKIAQAHPEWSLVIIGPIHGIDTALFSSCPNIYIMGPRDYSDLPNYLGGFDVCMIPFIQNELTLNTNPIKMYEYLAAGKPVVSTDLPEVSHYAGVVKVARSHQEFIAKIEDALRENRKPTAIKQKNINERQQVARENNWDIRCTQSLAIIEEYLSMRQV
jgi:glycosyltransferase involved in cell wall biosynthesis